MFTSRVEVISECLAIDDVYRFVVPLSRADDFADLADRFLLSAAKIIVMSSTNNLTCRQHSNDISEIDISSVRYKNMQKMLM